MRIGLEHHFVGGAHGVAMEINFATDIEEAVRLVGEAMRREGWSDSALVAVGQLPEATRTDWEDRATK